MFREAKVKPRLCGIATDKEQEIWANAHKTREIL